MAKTLGERLAAGDPDAFAALYDRLAARLLNTARTLTDSPPDAEDTVHDLFVQLARCRGRLETAPVGPPDDALAAAVAALPPAQREVLALKIDGGLTFAEIAAVIGTSINTAAGRYRYAIEKIRASITDPEAVR